MEKGVGLPRCMLRGWGRLYLETGFIPESKQGKHVNKISLLEGKDVIADVQLYLRNNKICKVPTDFIKHVKEQILPKTDPAASIQPSTATRWMNLLGLRF